MNINVKNAKRNMFHSRINEHISTAAVSLETTFRSAGRNQAGFRRGEKRKDPVGGGAGGATRGSCCQGGGGRGQAVWSLHFLLPLEGPPPAASLTSSQLTSCFSCGSASSSPKRADWSDFNVGITPKSEIPQSEINK